MPLSNLIVKRNFSNSLQCDVPIVLFTSVVSEALDNNLFHGYSRIMYSTTKDNCLKIT